jgi:carboxypeptidase Q
MYCRLIYHNQTKTIMRNAKTVIAAMLLLPMGAWAGGKTTPKENAKAAAEELAKIKEEGTTRSQVMNLAFHLTDVSGPRLAISPGYTKAANWAKTRLTEYGISNARLESWGEFGKGWEQQKCYVAMTAPYYTPIIAIPKAWTGSTPGKKDLTGEVVLITSTDSASFVQLYKGKLKGKIVMTISKDTLKPSFTPDGSRYADSTLQKMADAPPPIENRGPRPGGGANPEMAKRMQAAADARKMAELINAEEPGLILSISRGNDGTIFVQGPAGRAYDKDTKTPPANVVISSDEYLRIQRLVQAGIPVQMEAKVVTNTYVADTKGYNVIAEIPGTDPTLKDEIVMLGAHLDSWQGSTGATDNAAGSAVMMEAIRILKASGLQPRRTIRIALWNAEEQGLLGSRGWVNTHLADPVDMQLKAEHSKLSAYFNVDNGTGRIRGIYCQGNLNVMPIFQEYLNAFGDPLAKTVTVSNTGGTDHQSFDAVGIPGFQFIQDEIEYGTRTHHTNMDSYDHLVPEDLIQAATMVAAFAWQTSQRDEKLPRKELPKPRAGR